MSILNAALKPVRNRFSGTTAWLVAKLSWMERLYLGVGRPCWRLPLFESYYRRSNEVLLSKWRTQGRLHRSLDIRKITLVFDVSDFTAAPLFFRGQLFEPRTTAWVQEQLRLGDVFVDIGANRGYYAMMAARLVGPEGRVHAFEPNPAVLAELKRHLALNGLEGKVEVHEAALDDRAVERADFFIANRRDHDGFGSLMIRQDARSIGILSQDRSIQVRTVTYDAWADQWGLFERPASMLKIDVEGAEERVLKGMARTLAHCPPTHILCETSAPGPADTVLRDAGYRVELLEPIVGNTYGNWLYTRA